MSLILGPQDTGFGILIEGDAGYVESVGTEKKVITEGLELNPNDPVIINCILQKYGVENKNGRIYPPEVLVPQVEEYQKLIQNNSAVSEADHPESSIVSLDNIAHIIRKMWWGDDDKKNILYGQLEIITSPAYMRDGIVSMVGDKIVEYLRRGIKLGISSRGVGTLKELDGKNIVQDDFELICFDLVASPSTPGAYLFPNKNELEVQTVESEKPKNIISTSWMPNGKEKFINHLSENDRKYIDAFDKFLL